MPKGNARKLWTDSTVEYCWCWYINKNFDVWNAGYNYKYKYIYIYIYI